MAIINYQPTQPQAEAHAIDKYYGGIMGGYGSGKTHWLLMELLKFCNLNRGLPGGLLVPDYNMFYRDIIPSLDILSLENDFNYEVKTRPLRLIFPDTASTIYVFHSEDDGASIRGPNLAFGLVNEITICTQKAFEAFAARIRLGIAPYRKIRFSGTPEGFNWFYDMFASDPKDNVRLVFARTKDNPHLPDDYEGNLRSIYTAKMIEQFMDGKFINMNGQAAAWEFSRAKHVRKRIPLDESCSIWVTCDFNVSPMGAVIWQVVDDLKPHLQAIGEINIEHNANTFQLRDTLKSLLPGRKITIFPDPAGKANKTSSLYTDIEILEDVTHDIRYKRKIKSVKDCLNSMNKVLRDGIIEVDESCKEFIKDMEQCVLLSDFTIDKKDSKRTHWIDGFKDMCDFEFPIVNPNSKATVTRYG